MKSLVESINESHCSISSPNNEKELKVERAEYERDLKASKKHQEELEADFNKTTKELGYPGYKDMLERYTISVKFQIAREKADQIYCEEMIRSIDEMLKELK